ncbi:unannotated protein [freshwater metagenome]|uniref:Unannotated protein n=1 Tax=freshwater metagenome TaxID=449393 RepID=A0A6J7JIQ3_9ZZZZ|nr:MFS transporter [Actinomycetota bacterium]
MGFSAIRRADRRAAGRGIARDHPRYKWVVLTNTTVGMSMATINGSIVLISLPAIFRGINLNPLDPANVSYLLWMLTGFLLVSGMLVVTFGRLGDIMGRVRIYNLGFLVFAFASVALSLVPWQGGAGALWLIGWRAVEAVGAAMLLANATAILTDSFPVRQRGMALGVNQIAVISGSFLGLIIGGVVSQWHWRAVFWVTVPVGVLGAIWAYTSLHEIGERHKGRIDIPGNISFALGLGLILAGVTYGVQPYGGNPMGWTNPWVLSALIGGLALLAAFVAIELRVLDPMFDLTLFRIRAFTFGNLAGLMAAVSRGGMQLVLIIWLQGIWLPAHGYSFDSAPLWASVFLLPLTVGFLVAGPVSGWLSDRFGGRPFAVAGAVISVLAFIGLTLVPVDFPYPEFALLIFFNGVGAGMFSSPNATVIMNSVPAARRGVASGMRMTNYTAGSALSIGVFFSLLVIGLAGRLPASLSAGLSGQGVPSTLANQLGSAPPVGTLFSAFLGINPLGTLLEPSGVLHQLPSVNVDALLGIDLFPSLLSRPFQDGLTLVFIIGACMMTIAATASWLTGHRSSTSSATSGERLGEEPRDYHLIEGDPTADGPATTASDAGPPSGDPAANRQQGL